MEAKGITLDVATTTDMLHELDRRGLAFVYISVGHSGKPTDETRLYFGNVKPSTALEICDSACGFLASLV